MARGTSSMGPLSNRGYGLYGNQSTDQLDWWRNPYVPLYIRRQGEDFSDDSRGVKLNRAARDFSSFIGDVAGSIPILGGFLKSINNLTLNKFNQAVTDDYNAMQRAQAVFENWYNSPSQQLQRLRKAGINPYQANAVKSMPAASPNFQMYNAPVHSIPSTFAADVNALSNLAKVPYQIDNLQSLTDLNNYKHDFLFPQIFEKNGYVNNLLSLQSAWEDGNYKKERQIKQDLLQISSTFSLAKLGEEIMMLQPADGRTNIDAVNGQVFFTREVDGKDEVYDLSQLPFDQAPIFLQQAYLKTLAFQNGAELSEAQRSYYTSAANNQSMLASLNKFNADKLDLYLSTYRRTGVWPNEDPVLRSAAGLMDWEDVWQQGAFNFLTRSADKGVDYVGKYATRGKGGAPVKGYTGTKTYRSPSGVKSIDFETNYIY